MQICKPANSTLHTSPKPLTSRRTNTDATDWWQSAEICTVQCGPVWTFWTWDFQFYSLALATSVHHVHRLSIGNVHSLLFALNWHSPLHLYTYTSGSNTSPWSSHQQQQLQLQHPGSCDPSLGIEKSNICSLLGYFHTGIVEYIHNTHTSYM